MTIYYTIVLDYAGSLSLIAMLALAYGHLHRSLASPRLGQSLLGCAFGCVSMMQMFMPIEPIEGLIIDMRNIPIILCAAFLNVRATAVCFSIAAATRLGLGGVGMWAGVLGMSFAWISGVVWARLCSGHEGRNPRHLVALGVIGSSHLAGALILPEPAFSWFMSNAAGPIMLINLVTLPIVGYLIQAEQAQIRKEFRLLASANVDPDHGILTLPAFARDMQMQMSAGTRSAPEGLLVVKLRHISLLRSFVPAQSVAQMLGMVHQRLMEELPEGTIVGSIGAHVLLAPIGADQMRSADKLQMEIQRSVHEAGFTLPERFSLSLSVDVDVQPWTGAESLTRLARKELGRDAKHPARSARRRSARFGKAARAGADAGQSDAPVIGVAAKTVEDLFATAEAQMLKH